MSYLFFFDTETTGFGPDDEVIQFAGILTDANMNIIDVVNFYCNPAKIIPREAVNVHGLTNADVYKLSHGHFIDEFIFKYDWLVNPKDIVFIGYNVEFDVRLVNQSLLLNGCEGINFGTRVNVIPRDTKHKSYKLCMMETIKNNLGYYKNQKLVNVTREHLHFNSNKVVEKIELLCEYFNVDRPKHCNAHDALYDSFMTMMLFNRFKHFYLV